MAECIPTSLDNLDFEPTKGEERVFNLLRQLPEDCKVWYEVVLDEQSRKPDFVVLIPSHGIYILEVKDWSADAIKYATLREFTIQWKKNPSVTRKNPDRKCKLYLTEAKEQLELCDELVDDRDRLKVQVDYFVVFPNLYANEFNEKHLDQVVDRNKVIFADDMRDLTRFVTRFEQLIPPAKELSLIHI